MNNELNLNNQSKRLVAIDNMKAISIILVIVTHTFQAMGLYKSALVIGRPYWIDMAVPIFMILTGFTYSFSSNRRDIFTLKQWFKWDNINSKLLRILMPYVIVLFIETIGFLIFRPKTFQQFLYGYFTGGWGPGSYYTPVLIQVLILFPILFVVFRKYPILAVVLSFGVDLGFDILAL